MVATETIPAKTMNVAKGPGDESPDTFTTIGSDP
jgi:hypothetical protein